MVGKMEYDIWDKNWDNLTSNIYQNTSLDSSFAKNAYKCITKWGIKDGSRILEAGAGTGRFCIALAKEYPNSMIYGIDKSINSISISKKGAQLHGVNNIEFSQGDIFKLPFPDENFDMVFNEGVIEHFHNYEDSIKEMIRVTKTDGRIIIAVPNWYCFPHTIYKKIVGDKFEYGYEKSFKHNELIQVVTTLGLKQVEIAGFYPAHGVKRLSKYSIIFSSLGDFLDSISDIVDLHTNNIFSKYFGFEIVVKGVKK